MLNQRLHSPNIGLLIDVPANDTVVLRAASYPRFLPPCCFPFPAWSSIQAATSLLTYEAFAPVSNTVAALNDGRVPTVMQHI